ncbi:cytochrome c oxidase accessory protein CcoG [Thioclava sp. GXIMD4216]|uniref:Cytochrome c oxidase accessory protein CcoG n=1 Tax=Thioclava litoralis TaxID=3076557 RepID=A0ABZ1DV92_9RHOB|nr:cytochrome c oxidase accessory protein CcoG [Thioclava sp. FTW29]
MSAPDPVAPPPLYASREPIFPRHVRGKFRSLKWWLMGMMLGIYYILPWVRWDRGPALPDQAVLVDLANRRFFFFMIEIWPHEFYFVAGLLIMAGLGLFLFTAAMGRVWCGYACPQTVWTDLFMHVERWIEGDRNAQIRLLRSRWTGEKIRKRALKWALWLVIAVGTGGAWVFYFADAPTLLRQLVTGQAAMVAYLTLLVLTATTFFFGGFAREQICIYACPWPRIQAAMMDEDTLTIGYRNWRGEPRGKLKKGVKADAAQGDCIDCNACVNVCPMGIDIRDGQQMECITCGLCIDACNEIMDKTNQPHGLIGYMALRDEEREKKGEARVSPWRHIFRLRTIIYFVLWGGIGVGLIVALLVRSPIEFNVTPNRSPLYVTQPDGTIRNIYALRLRNKEHDPTAYVISVTGMDGQPVDGLRVKVEGRDGALVIVPADTTLSARLYLEAVRGSALADATRSDLVLRVSQKDGDRSVTEKTVFNGKGRN